MSNFQVQGHYATKIEIKQIVGDSYGKVEIVIHSQYSEDSSEKFTIDAYTLDGGQIPIEQSIDANSLRSKVKRLEADNE